MLKLDSPLPRPTVASGALLPPSGVPIRPVLPPADRFEGTAPVLGGAFTGARARLSGSLNVRPQGQGDTNACGTTSLAMVLSYFGRPTDHATLDREIRRLDMFSHPADLVDVARQRGMRAELKMGGSLEDVARLIDQGVPPMALIEPGRSSDFGLHYVVVSGYRRDPQGNVTSVTLTDPVGAGRVRTMSAADFLAAWSNLKVAGVATGLDRTLISVVPPGDAPVVGADGVTRPAARIALPRSEAEALLGAMPGLTLSNGLTNLVNGLRNGDLGTTAAGVIQTFFGAGLFALSKVPLLGRLAEPLAWAINELARGTEWLGNRGSDAFKQLASVLARTGVAIAEAAHYLLQQVGSVARQALEGIGRAARSVARFFGF